MERRFEGKVAVVTGAAGGIGSATAARFASEGAAVVLVDLPGAGLSDVERRLTEAGVETLAAAADVTDSAQVQGYVDAALERFGRIDCFHNNAGIEGVVSPLLDYPEDVYERVMAVNAKGVWLGLKHVGAAMRNTGGGAIVSTASGAGLGAVPALSPYCASKHAVIGLTKTAAVEFAEHGIRVNAVAPGPIETRMIESLERQRYPDDPERGRAERRERIPMRRLGEAQEVAALVAYLCSDDASYVSGSIVSVDGGSRAR